MSCMEFDAGVGIGGLLVVDEGGGYDGLDGDTGPWKI